MIFAGRFLSFFFAGLPVIAAGLRSSSLFVLGVAGGSLASISSLSEPSCPGNRFAAAAARGTLEGGGDLSLSVAVKGICGLFRVGVFSSSEALKRSVEGAIARALSRTSFLIT